MENEQNKVLELPILKHFEKGDISFDPQTWKKGEKILGLILGLALLGTTVWGLYSYILPIVFTWIGQVLGAIMAAVMVIAFFINFAQQKHLRNAGGQSYPQQYFATILLFSA